MLISAAANSDSPWRSKYLAKELDIPFNESVQRCTTIYGWLRGYRTVPFDKLIVLVELGTLSWKDVESHILSIKAG